MVEFPIYTDRLVLRVLEKSDVDAHLRMFSIPSVVRYLYDEPLTPELAEEHLAKRFEPNPFVENNWMNLAVTLDDEYIGEIGVCQRSLVHKQCELGWVFMPDVAGNGYATEAAAAMRDFAFKELDAHRVAAHFDIRNEASARVMQRLGMRFEAHLVETEFIKGEWTDEGIYAITRAEWEALTQAE